MKIVIIGAGSVAFTPAILSGLGTDPRYRGASIGLVDVDEAALELIASFAARISREFQRDWIVEASTERRDVLSGADVVTTSVGVGGLSAWRLDLEIPFRHGIVQPVGDTSGPGGLARALRHIPVHVEIAKDMEELCPDATLYNFSNPLTVNTQAVNKHSRIRCIGLCIGPDLTWDHLCRVIGVEKRHTSAVIGGINHCHWVTGLRIRGEDAFPLLRAALDEREGNAAAAEGLRARFAGIVTRPRDPVNAQPLCAQLFRHFGAYPGPGDNHVAEFFPHLMTPLITKVETYHGEAIRYVDESYPALWKKMVDISKNGSPIDTEAFAKELAWEHTQFLDILVSQMDDLGQVFHVNIPNKGHIHNLPDGAVVEVPARVDRAGLHPFALADLPAAITPVLVHKLASLDLIIEAALEGSREKAIQAYLNDPHANGVEAGARLVNELIDSQLNYLPRFA